MKIWITCGGIPYIKKSTTDRDEYFAKLVKKAETDPDTDAGKLFNAFSKKFKENSASGEETSYATFHTFLAVQRYLDENPENKALILIDEFN